ncbi:BPSS1780 family membrane protein [Thiocapsa sp.]|uniref:BPSS1780 family membrane protein n=1 Tax=Thiocapsa sp. TaxID=2024551 RepID=UPI0025F4BCDE|nr:BPSS1780 family membrane protein [Thiocapsa sp.]
MEGRYRILYAGELMPGHALQDVVPRLAAKFKLQEETARDLILGGSGRVLKHSLTSGEAQRYRDALSTIGLKVAIDAESSTNTAPASVGSRPDRVVASQAPQRNGTEASPPTDDRRQGDARQTGDARLGGEPESGPEADPTRCPKCGADAVSELTGVCQACGVVVERYLANRGMSPPRPPNRVDNPYAPPRADLTPPRPEGEEDVLQAPQSRPVGHGWLWITEAWQLFKAQPGAWIGAVVLFYIILILVSIVPLAGSLAVTILTPMLSAGLVIGAHRQYREGRFAVSHLFAGVSESPGPLALVGVVYLLLALAIVIVAGALFAAVFASMGSAVDLSTMDPNDIDIVFSNPMILLPVLVAMLLGIPLAMAMFFAPSLVALDQVPVFKAFGLSLSGCLKNILPFLIYGLVAMVLVILGSLPLMLGLLVVVPVLTIAIYTAYRDIFYP